MKKIFLVLSLLTLTSGLAMADEGFLASEDSLSEMDMQVDAGAPAKASPCAQIKLTDAQKAQIKAGAANYKKAAKVLFAKVKADKAAFEKVAVNKASTVPAAQAASQALSTDMAQVFATKQAFRAEVLFQVLTADQRAPAIACQKLMAKKHRRHCRHHRRGHGVQSPGQPTESTQPS
jgi:LTXXQ motif family protein